MVAWKELLSLNKIGLNIFLANANEQAAFTKKTQELQAIIDSVSDQDALKVASESYKMILMGDLNFLSTTFDLRNTLIQEKARSLKKQLQEIIDFATRIKKQNPEEIQSPGNIWLEADKSRRRQEAINQMLDATIELLSIEQSFRERGIDPFVTIVNGKRKLSSEVYPDDFARKNALNTLIGRLSREWRLTEDELNYIKNKARERSNSSYTISVT